MQERYNYFSSIYAGILFLTFSANLFAEACTFNEANLALQNGNLTRGLNLMKMAANDGDKRAISFITKHEKQLVTQLDNKMRINNSKEKENL